MPTVIGFYTVLFALIYFWQWPNKAARPSCNWDLWMNKMNTDDDSHRAAETLMDCLKMCEYSIERSIHASRRKIYFQLILFSNWQVIRRRKNNSFCDENSENCGPTTRLNICHARKCCIFTFIDGFFFSYSKKIHNKNDVSECYGLALLNHLVKQKHRMKIEKNKIERCESVMAIVLSCWVFVVRSFDMHLNVVVSVSLRSISWSWWNRDRKQINQLPFFSRKLVPLSDLI